MSSGFINCAMLNPAQSGCFCILPRRLQVFINSLRSSQKRMKTNFLSLYLQFFFTLCFINVNRFFYTTRSTMCNPLTCFPYVPLICVENDNLYELNIESEFCIHVNCDGENGNCCLLSGLNQTLKRNLSIHLIC